MTPKEALIIVTIWGHDKEHHKLVCNSQEFLIVYNTLTELEELKRDVKRYFELNKIGSIGSLKEHIQLHDKLSKVGKEE
jgi:hypothetical protein